MFSAGLAASDLALEEASSFAASEVVASAFGASETEATEIGSVEVGASAAAAAVGSDWATEVAVSLTRSAVPSAPTAAEESEDDVDAASTSSACAV